MILRRLELWAAAFLLLLFSVPVRADIANVRVSPMALLSGIYGAYVDLGLTPTVAMGPSFQWFSTTTGGRTVTVRQYAISGTIYLKKNPSGRIFVRPTIAYLPVQTVLGARLFTSPSYAVGSVAGYQWLWENGFNINFGIGVAYHDVPPGTPGAVVTGAPASELQPEMELGVGWQF